MLLQHQLPHSEELLGHRRDSLWLEGISTHNRFLGFAHGGQLKEWRAKPGEESCFSSRAVGKNGRTVAVLHLQGQAAASEPPTHREQRAKQHSIYKTQGDDSVIKARKEFRAKCDCTRGEGKSHCNP